MHPPEKMMRIEVRNAAGGWDVCPDFGQLEAGDIIRWFNPDGTPGYDGREMEVERQAAIRLKDTPFDLERAV